ncbi:MAG: hypothetical protein A4E32_00620 [Methanomassiliicoccales archaeon PtaU1.Bin124]|nr:MAG: hypothetical protein A4E32_00620 [Methanomassiliicoccales archaeon PtaU1.Bin124]
MMARCGFQCDRCPMFDGNIKDQKDRAVASAGWRHYWNLSVPVNDVRCKGCLEPRGEGYEYPDKACKIKVCAEDKKLDHCGQCKDYPCSMMSQRLQYCDMVIETNLARANDSDRAKFLEPFDARKNIDVARNMK